MYLDRQSGITGTRVIIADSSDDKTCSLIQQTKLENIKVEFCIGGLPGIARNNGSKLVNTPWVLFLDSDIFLQDFMFLEKIFSNLHGIDLASCKLRTDDIYSIAYVIFDLLTSISSLFEPFAIGGFMLFRREKFIELGGFDEKAQVAEDWLLSRKVSPKKFKIFNIKAFTSSRRFKQKGMFYMTKLLIDSWINRNRLEFFYQKNDYFIK
jgi:glycosyltransferase involved in cell wall biosynthesis